MESRPPRGQIRLLDAYPTSCRYAIDAKRPLHVCHHASDLSQGQWLRSRQSAELIAASRASPTFSKALGCDVAQALLPAASALMPTLGDDTLSETRTRVETSLDTADTSVRATYAG
jgi:hypothetical protein